MYEIETVNITRAFAVKTLFFSCSVKYLSVEKQPDFWDMARSSGKQVDLMTINRFLCISF